ncbi:MAG TPA: hydroxymethylbilane synthase [Xanthobacteraceae bacterium]|nr:hydroxymethylbilane synthase [Xanthobacteraceae bacterium]
MPQSSILLRLGTRGSPLALAQARMVQERLAAAHGFAPERIAIETIHTTGDRVQDRPLAELGGKGLFAKEIEEALIARRIDLAVHSAKDLAALPRGLTIAACLPREDPRDVFVSRRANDLLALPPGAVVGTASPRRQALVKHLRPDLRVVPLRGNVETRLRKLAEGAADATILALAGLKRLGMEAAATSIFAIDEFLPAVGQGAIAVEIRADDHATAALLAPIDHMETSIALAAERAMLTELGGTCRTPIAGHAIVTAACIRIRGLIAKPDGSLTFEAVREGAAKDAAALGADLGRELKSRATPDFFGSL